MAGHGSQLPRMQERAIACLLTCRSIKAAATKAKVGYRTLKGWLQEPEFQVAYRDARSRTLMQVIAQLQAVGRQAVAALRRGLKSKEPKVYLKAAATVLTQMTRATFALQKDERFAAMEAQIAELLRAKNEPPPAPPSPPESQP